MIGGEITCGDFLDLIKGDRLGVGVFLGVIVESEAKQFVHASGEGDGTQVLSSDFLLSYKLGLCTPQLIFSEPFFGQVLGLV